MIFDPIRKKYVALTPEEWVRQHILHYLLELGYPSSLMAIERAIEVNGLLRRFDVVVYDRDAQPLILVECKAQSESLDHTVVMQAIAYNLTVKARYLWLTNGTHTYFIRLSDGTVLGEVVRFDQILSNGK
ncbi:MAG: type I restriction enzyme HsdR N-terminal domain-containing protein [Bacteroidetes bacterium]|nr:type I restriction enzyme HsdR N-terminal domain-containing protein [Bacteroidota bacterium]